mmetsp:Transcript_16913/g.47161  ORF Transcript_16913/g.47161 Transcript_16913/m.47161 type:complete len:186 (+) Transcript_16913:504-1061(+)
MFILPCLMLLWVGNALSGAAEYIYLLTGAYVLSDSLINYSPVAVVIASGRSPRFSWGVHAHHFFTLILCLLGTTLPSWLENEGAVAILVGELGSLWITVALLRPTATNMKIRYLSFLLSRLCAVPIAVDIAWQAESDLYRVLIVILAAGLLIDNARTLRAMQRQADSLLAGQGATGENGVGSWPL